MKLPQMASGPIWTDARDVRVVVKRKIRTPTNGMVKRLKYLSGEVYSSSNTGHQT